MSAVQQASPIELSQEAQEKIRELLQEEADDELCLKCSSPVVAASFQYSFTFDDERAGDTLISLNGVRVLSTLSAMAIWLARCWIIKKGWKARALWSTNPSASSTCGNGSSFSI